MVKRKEEKRNDLRYTLILKSLNMLAQLHLFDTSLHLFDTSEEREFSHFYCLHVNVVDMKCVS